MFAIIRRSTSIAMKARSNLWRQASEAASNLAVGTEMILALVITVASATRCWSPAFCR